jgi:hypothetical protein
MKINTFLCRNKSKTIMEQKQINLTHLREILPSNWAAIISEKHNVSDRFVRMVMSGDRDSQTALEVATSIIELAGQHKKKIQDIQQKATEI